MSTTSTMSAVWPTPGPVPDVMKAVPLVEFGGPDVLRLAEMPTPQPPPGEVLVKVGAVSVGRLLDVVARAGRHPYATFQFPHILGAESAGTVAALGAGVDNVSIGDRVAVFPVVVTGEDELTRSGLSDLSPLVQNIGTHRPGAYAEYVNVPAQNLRIVPDGMSPDDAVAIVLAGAVAMNQFSRVGGVGADSRVVVQAATSALGLTTALLARHLGAQVIVTSRDSQKRQRLGELGFESVLDATAEDFVDAALDVFGGRGAHVVVDNLAIENVWRAGLGVLAPGGGLVTSGAFLGHEMPVDVKRLYTFGQRIIGVRTGTLASLDRLWTEVARGFRGVVDRTFPLADAASAHRYVEAGQNVGRVALTVGG